MTEAALQANTTEDAVKVNGHNPLRALCAGLHARIEAFLREDVKTEKLRRVQAQTRIAFSVVQEALQRYSYVVPCSSTAEN